MSLRSLRVTRLCFAKQRTAASQRGVVGGGEGGGEGGGGGGSSRGLWKSSRQEPSYCRAVRSLRVRLSAWHHPRNSYSCANHGPTDPPPSYQSAFLRSVREPEDFWSECARGVTWFKPWSQTMDHSRPPYTRWFVDGELNVCYNALDRHVENGLRNQLAIIYDSPVTGTKQKITYKEALEQVSKLADVLVKQGVQKGDRVTIYMPMIPQAIYAMLACARIGAIHSLIFGGFASKELSVRIQHTKPKLVLTASFGIEPGRKINYVQLLDKALEMIQHKVKVIIYNRYNMERVPLTRGRDLDWDEEISAAQSRDCVPLNSDHPLYILYTSGTTGQPKGIVRPSGGHAVVLNWTMSNVYGVKPGEVWLTASDLGWVVGHSYICYAPLLHGNTTVLYEGKPVGTPDSGAFFRLLSEYGIAAMFTSPTALRAIHHQEHEALLGRHYNFPRFRALFVGGEHCDVDTLQWAKESFRAPVLDHWWQTETGSPITATCIGLGLTLNPPSGQAGKCLPGYNAVILGNDMKEVKRNTLGNIAVKLPLAPGSMATLWENDELFKKLYFTKFPGYYDTMDAGYMDDDGYVYVMSRIDDVINVAGHRLSTGGIEEVILSHPAVFDCAVVAQEDSIKGHVPLALCVKKEVFTEETDQIREEIVQLVRNSIGPVAAFKKTLFVTRLPKTRSGKIPRSALAAIVNGKPYTITATIEDPAVFSEIEEVIKETKNII
uniref:Acyl-CoA synthetase short-chain family member 3, mitochondrial n=1 Tax=Callorhinchus milii TaxID=7868 RepID=A0A4W3GQU4_CALMI|eukprot:gi/632971033/ref/XP_007901973.1/ PREDICTED: acyl-CoA synthetase short-chain family member 3, mitochondrial isoform X1 [Callorhinchus milii]